jgi:hypothetical protein
VSLRPLYLIFARLCSWLVLFGRSSASKDAPSCCPISAVPPGHPGHAFRQPLAGQHPPRSIHQLHIVMVLRPVIPDEQPHMFSRPRSRTS